jgi:hypothetical protein
MIENPESSYWIPGSPARSLSSGRPEAGPVGFGARNDEVLSGRSGHDVAAAKVDAGGGEGTVRFLGGCGSRDDDARLEFALVGDL